MSDSSVSTAASSSAGPARNKRIAAGAGLLALTLGTGGAVSAMVGSSDEVASCAEPAKVSVSVTPELYPVVFEQVDALESNPTLCADYVVSRASGESVNRAVKAGGQGIPDVWIPDSSMWVDDATAKLGAGWVGNSGSIAGSPVVVGVPQAQSSLPGFDKTPSWAQLLSDGNLPVTVQDTGVSSTALAAMTVANRGSGTRQERTDLLRSIVRLSRSTLSPESLAGRAAQGSDVARAYPLSEQQLLEFDRTHPDKKLRPLIPQEGVPQLDFPFVRPVKATSAPQNAIDALLASLRSAQAKSALNKAGFRVPGGQAPDGSALPSDIKLVAAPKSAENVSAVTSWGDLARDARMLVLVDVSGSMIAEVGPKQSRIDLLASTAKLALNALPGTTQIGAWAFSTDLDGKGKDYLAIVPEVAEIGNTPAGNAHKQKMVDKLGQLPALVKKNGDTGLYDSIWAAYQAATKSYRDGYVNSIVVMTDGKNDDPGGGLSLQQLLKNLGGAYKPDKPIKLVAISMGQDTDPAALKQIARATDGLSYVTKDPSEISTVFVDAFLHRS